MDPDHPVNTELEQRTKHRDVAFEALLNASFMVKDTIAQNASTDIEIIRDLERAYDNFCFKQGKLAELISASGLKSDSAEATVNGKTLLSYAALRCDALKIITDSVNLWGKYVLNMNPCTMSTSCIPCGTATPVSFSSSVDVTDHSDVSNLCHSVNSDSLLLSDHLSEPLHPEWDGEVVSWLGWKVSWETEVVPKFHLRKLDLAQLLKKCVKGEGLREIQNIALSDPNCYDLMWQKLTDRFDNIALTVQVVMNNFANLKQVRENDQNAMLDFIRDATSIQSQLVSLYQADQVESILVSELSSLIPASMQKC